MLSNAATGAPAVEAVTSNPGGGSWTASLWLIHTGCWAGVPECSTPPSVVIVVRPNSRPPVLATTPPSAFAMAW